MVLYHCHAQYGQNPGAPLRGISLLALMPATTKNPQLFIFMKSPREKFCLSNIHDQVRIRVRVHFCFLKHCVCVCVCACAMLRSAHIARFPYNVSNKFPITIFIHFKYGWADTTGARSRFDRKNWGNLRASKMPKKNKKIEKKKKWISTFVRLLARFIQHDSMVYYGFSYYRHGEGDVVRRCVSGDHIFESPQLLLSGMPRMVFVTFYLWKHKKWISKYSHFHLLLKAHFLLTSIYIANQPTPVSWQPIISTKSVSPAPNMYRKGEFTVRLEWGSWFYFEIFNSH